MSRRGRRACVVPLHYAIRDAFMPLYFFSDFRACLTLCFMHFISRYAAATTTPLRHDDAIAFISLMMPSAADTRLS